MRIRSSVAAGLGLVWAVAAQAQDTREADLAAARAVFERNLAAIANEDAAGYLDCYWTDESLTRNGPGGPSSGYAEWAKSVGGGWPEVFEGADLKLTWLRPSFVYGSYRYRVRFNGAEQTGISERVFLNTESGWKIAVTTAFPDPGGTPPPPLALTGATLIDGTGADPVPGAVVLVRNGVIECAGDCDVPDGVRTVDVSGSWIVPGLIDSHVHFSQSGFADGRPDALDLRARYPYAETERGLREHPERFFRAYLGSGVTTVFDVGGYPWTVALREAHATDLEAPRIRAAGPVVSTIDHWLNLPGERQILYAAGAAAVDEEVAYLATLGVDAVKFWYIPGTRDATVLDSLLYRAGAQARARGLPLIVHATGLHEAKVAVAAGARLLVHGVDDLPVDDAFLAAARDSGVIYCPTLVVRDGYRRLFDEAVRGARPELDDPIGVVDSLTLARTLTLAVSGEFRDDAALRATLERLTESTGRALRTSQANLVRVYAAGVPIALGTDAGNPLTLHGVSVFAELESMQEAGLSPSACLIAATAGAARAAGVADVAGTLEPGKSADLVVLARDPLADIANLRSLTRVMRGGELRPVTEFASRVGGQR